MATRCARAMLSSRRWEIITEKRKNTTRKTGREKKQRQRRIGQARPRAQASSTPRIAREHQHGAAANSQVTEYSARMCARRTENSTMTSSSRLTAAVTFKRRSIYPPAAGAAAGPCRRQATPPPAFISQDVDEDSQQHVHDVVERASDLMERTAGRARVHLARALPRSGNGLRCNTTSASISGIFQRESCG